MSLVPCPECGRQVSDYAATCPQCGHLLPMSVVPLAEPFEPIPPPDGASGTTTESRSSPAPNWKHIAVAVLLTLLVVSLGLGALWWFGLLR
jgi:hypothetical protein